MARIAHILFRLLLAFIHNVWTILFFLMATSILLVLNHYWAVVLACYGFCANTVLQTIHFMQSF